jgi:putative transposase
LALSEAERQDLLQILDSERFADVAPATVYATLLDEGRYHGSVRTMYRLLAQENQSGERRRQRVHPVYEKPELLATGANEVLRCSAQPPEMTVCAQRLAEGRGGLERSYRRR